MDEPTDRPRFEGAVAAVLTDEDAVVVHHVPNYTPGDGPLLRMACGLEERAIVLEHDADLLEDILPCGQCFLVFNTETDKLEFFDDSGHLIGEEDVEP